MTGLDCMEPRRTTSLVALALLTFLAIFAVFPTHALPVGITISSGDSMEPAISDGPNLIVYAEQPDYDEGDIIVFEAQDTGNGVTHRIVAENPVNEQPNSDEPASYDGYLTKGDAHENLDQKCCLLNDETLTRDDVYGRAVIIIEPPA